MKSGWFSVFYMGVLDVHIRNRLYKICDCIDNKNEIYLSTEILNRQNGHTATIYWNYIKTKKININFIIETIAFLCSLSYTHMNIVHNTFNVF